MLILNGAHRDAEALLEGIEEKSFSATLTLDLVRLPAWTSAPPSTPSLVGNAACRLQGQQKGRRVDVAYEDFSKLA